MIVLGCWLQFLSRQRSCHALVWVMGNCRCLLHFAAKIKCVTIVTSLITQLCAMRMPTQIEGTVKQPCAGQTACWQVKHDSCSLWLTDILPAAASTKSHFVIVPWPDRVHYDGVSSGPSDHHRVESQIAWRDVLAIRHEILFNLLGIDGTRKQLPC